jgi:hypothetical protein
LSALPALLPLLDQDSDWNVRILALKTLAEFGTLDAGTHDNAEYRAAVGRVTKIALEDEYSFVRETAARTLVALAPADAQPTLRKMADSDPEVRVRKAARSLISRSK